MSDVMSDSYPLAPAPRRGMAMASLALGILNVLTAIGLFATVGLTFRRSAMGQAASLLATVCCAVAVIGVVLGLLATIRANRAPHLYGGRRLAITGTNTSVLAGLMLLPFGIQGLSMCSGGSSNESATVADIRTFISAEAAYQSASGRYYGSPECLAAPSTCIPGYPGSAPTFLDSQLASMVAKSGYRRTFHPGPLVSAPTNSAGDPIPSESFERFAYTAVPVEPGVTGRWSFCGDLSPTTSGRLCQVRSGPIYASGGQCPPPPACAEYEPGR